jgi:hypothetical protein
LLLGPSSLWEIALHPNFNPLLDGQSGPRAKEILSQLKDLYPEALGIRCHSRTISSKLLALFSEMEFTYDANQICPYAEHLAPYSYGTLVRFTDYFQDDLHAWFQHPFSLGYFQMKGHGLKIYNFHPIHIYLNTESLDRYEAARPHFQKMNTLSAYVNRSQAPGARNLFIELLSYINLHSLSASTLGAAARAYSESRSTDSATFQ